MIRLVTNTPEFFGDIAEVIRLFLGNVEIHPENGDSLFRHSHTLSEGKWIETCEWEGKTSRHEAPLVQGGLIEKRLLKRAVKTGCFLLLLDVTKILPPWGSLTGIRPTRLMYELLEEGHSSDEAAAILTQRFFVSPEKADLLKEIVGMQRGLVETPDNAFDVYIGIPFCTTRCAYCSFSAGELGDGHLVRPYLEALKAETRACAAFLSDAGYRVRAAYMGGGTPTALTAAQLDEILDEIQSAFPNAREWTVEAGRPDTIDVQKLRVMKAHDIGRISVNPQTFSDDTLQRIGRAHTAKDTLTAFHLARAEGFHHINMDLIAALPGEDLKDFEASLETTCALAPESITVHTLAIKRSSKLHEQSYRQAAPEIAQRMVEIARNRLTNLGYNPYYLYRQKYMAGNLENVGYARPNHACLYNIDNMEETTRVLALGAGAITKWLFPRERRIERAPNVRNIEEYIARVDEMVRRKRTLIIE